jgi:pilus assembly protein Flp/PilA
MSKLIKRLFTEESGAEVTEYALILGLVAIAAAVGANTLGGDLNGWYNALAGNIQNISSAPQGG